MMASNQESICFTCEVLGQSRTGFHNWRSRKLEVRSDPNEELQGKIIELHKTSKGSYGVNRIYKGLGNQGETASRNRVHRQMKKLGVQGKTRKRFIPRTTINSPSQRKSPRIFEGDLEQVKAPNEVWVGDITYIHTKEGFLYLAIMLDLFSRMIVGWRLEDHMEESLVRAVLEKALTSRRLRPKEVKLLTHTDQGSQYEAREYRKLLKLFGILQSMSRKGNCYDNAFAEAFFKTLKTELELQTFETKQQAREYIFEYIEAWYNTQRIHSSLGYVSPDEYERRYYEAKTA